MLLAKLKSLLGAESDATSSNGRDPLELASAALMMEVARADFTTDPVELDAIRAMLITHFSLTDGEVADLVAEAAGRVDAATCLFEFTRLINEEASLDQKRALITQMWRVALADDALSHYEEHLIRKVSELLYVTHNDFMVAKLTAQSAQP
jgi:uncharacterized tellurite resistance protein B-like protein